MTLINSSNVREEIASSKFDALIRALCQEHHDCLRHLREEGNARRTEATVGSRLSGDMIVDLDYRRLSSAGWSTSQSWKQTSSRRSMSARRTVSYATHPSDVSTVDTSRASVQSERADYKSRSRSVSLDCLDATLSQNPTPKKQIIYLDDGEFVQQDSPNSMLVPTTIELSIEPARSSSISRATSRVRFFDLRQSWKEAEWDPNRPSQSTQGKLDCVDSDDGEQSEGRRYSRYRSLTDRLVLHPNSRKRYAWHVLCFVFILYDIIVVPLQVFSFEDAETIKIGDWMGRLVWTLDIPVSCFAGFYFKGRLHMSFQATRYQYLITWFPFDLLLVLSDWLFFFMTAETSYSKLFRIARIARTLRVLRLVKIRGLLQTIEDTINTENIAIYFRCLKPLFAVLLFTHVLACGWFGIGMWDDDYEHSWIMTFACDRRSPGYQYATSLHWAIAQFTLNTMDVYARNLGERLYTIAVSLFGIIGFSVLVSGFTSAAEQLREIKSDETKQFWILRRFTKDHAISHKLSHRLMRYCEYKYLDQKARIQPEDVGLMKLLSEQLRQEVGMEMHLPQLTPHPLFLKMQHLKHRSLRSLCFNLSPRSYARGDSIVAKGEDSAEMIMITQGAASYSYTGKRFRRTQRLESGHWLCEASLWTYWTVIGDAKAVVHSRALVIFADMLEKVFAVAPVNEVAYVQRYAQKFVAMLNSLSRDCLTDFISSVIPSEVDTGSMSDDYVGGAMQVLAKHFGSRISRRGASSMLRRSGTPDVDQPQDNAQTEDAEESQRRCVSTDFGRYLTESIVSSEACHV